MENKVLGEVHFKFSTRFSQLIGRNLISNPIVAVLELVKNSYDADADNIDIVFENLKNGTPCLRIIDDGDGMSYDDISNKWMMVGTDNKIQNPITKKNRRKLGEKGIGRFSVERLAEKLLIKTSQLGQNFALILSINWNEYETAVGEFSEIKHNITSEPCNENYKGTELYLEGLRDNWNEETLINLRRELNLIRPIDLNKVTYKKYEFLGDNVSIKLIAKDYFKLKTVIEPHFMSFAQAHLYGEIKNNDLAIVRVSIKSNVSMSNQDIDETYTFNSENIDLSCGPVTYEAFVFWKDKRLYRSLDIDKKEMVDYLNSLSGVKIYRDGFRILPFGDVGNDWLELNAQRTKSPEHRISTNNAIGVVYITRDDNPGLQDVLSRENMYNTKEYTALKSFVNLAFEKYTALQLSARKTKERKVHEEGKGVLTDAKSSVTSFSKQVVEFKNTFAQIKEVSTPELQIAQVTKVESKLTNLLSTAESSLETIMRAYKFYKLQDDFRSRETQIYRNIATLGISAAMFGHEALNQTVEAKAICNEIADNYKDAIATIGDLQQILIDLKSDIDLIDEKADFFRNYLRREKQDRARLIDINNTVEKLLLQHNKAFDAIGVAPKILTKQIKSFFVTWGYEGDFETIFTNLITNAYKALKKAVGVKYFNISLDVINNEIVIISENNGKIIEKNIRSKIFEPLYSTYSDGTGLGLTIVQDTILSYHGSIELCDDYPQTCFKINIPKQDPPKEDEE